MFRSDPIKMRSQTRLQIMFLYLAVDKIMTDRDTIS